MNTLSSVSRGIHQLCAELERLIVLIVEHRNAHGVNGADAPVTCAEVAARLEDQARYGQSSILAYTRLTEWLARRGLPLPWEQPNFTGATFELPDGSQIDPMDAALQVRFAEGFYEVSYRPDIPTPTVKQGDSRPWVRMNSDHCKTARKR